MALRLARTIPLSATRTNQRLHNVHPHSRLPPSQIPQVFVNSEFVGGCDILEEMHLSGELRKLLSS